MYKNKKKKLKPVKCNGECNSPLQFNVVKDTQKAKKVKSKEVFDSKKKKCNGSCSKKKCICPR